MPGHGRVPLGVFLAARFLATDPYVLRIGGTPIVGLLVWVVFVVLSRPPADASQPVGAAETAAPAPVETGEPLLAGGCFGPGSSRAEVRAAMGAPDTVLYGVWEYGRSNVRFGYGAVVYYSNEGGNLRLCSP